MDSGADTPEGFLHETKFVVLSYLGLVPHDFDPGFSEFDKHSSDSSHPQTPFSLPGSEENSHCASPRFLSVRAKYGQYTSSRSQSFSPSSKQSRSPALSPRGSQKKKEKLRVEHDEVCTTVDLVTSSGETVQHTEELVVQESVELSADNGAHKDQDLEVDSPDDDENDLVKEPGTTITTTVETTETLESVGGAPVLPVLQTSAVAPEINVVTPGTTCPPSAFAPVKGSSDGDSPTKLIIPTPQSGSSSGSSSAEIGKGSSDSDSSGLLGVDDSWSQRKRKSIEELTEPLKEGLQEAFDKLGMEKEYFDAMYPCDGNQASDSPTVIPPICPLAREAIVAERIAQIGDMIMVQHREELEAALSQVFGETARGGSINYLMFKSMVKHMMRSTVPEWYHLALMLNFTRRMANGFLNRGNQSMGYLSDYAVRYIEENLADTIIDQGGWDAMVNINPEDVEEISSRSVSPMPPDTLSHAATPLPGSPPVIKESPVDPPMWQHTTTTHVHVSAVTQSNVGHQKPDNQPESNMNSTSVENKPVDQVDGKLVPNLTDDTPTGEQGGMDQTSIDQSGGDIATEDHTQVDSKPDDRGIAQYVFATAAGVAAAAGAVYALMKR